MNQTMSREDVLLILNCIMYSESVDINYDTKNNIFDFFNSDLVPIKPDDAIATDAEWNTMIAAINADKEYFSNIQLVNVERTKDKEKNATFINNNNSTPEVYIVYAGTGALEWHDNANGGTWDTNLTPQQQNAVDYANKIVASYPNLDSYVSGHSKGGNKAQVVTILVDEIKHGYSFDGQGVGHGFMLKYKDLVAANKAKLTSISNSGDYVNPMFIGIAGTVLFTENDKTMIDRIMDKEFQELGNQHSPFSMIQYVDKKIRMRKTTGIKQDSLAVFMGNTEEYLSETMSDADFKTLTNIAMHQLDKDDCADPDFNMADIPFTFWIRLIQHLYGFSSELNISLADMFVFLLNIDILIPDNELVGCILSAAKVMGPASLGIAELAVSNRIIGQNQRTQLTGSLNNIINNYNSANALVDEARENIHDFSYKTQELMRASLKLNIDTQDMEMNNLPGFQPCEDLLLDYDVYTKHLTVKKELNDLMEKDAELLTKYNVVVEAVCRIDDELAEVFKGFGDQLQAYTNALKS